MHLIDESYVRLLTALLSLAAALVPFLKRFPQANPQKV
jgi:hypothetical protein